MYMIAKTHGDKLHMRQVRICPLPFLFNDNVLSKQHSYVATHR